VKLRADYIQVAAEVNAKTVIWRKPSFRADFLACIRAAALLYGGPQ
jgi:hypothetical protein